MTKYYVMKKFFNQIPCLLWLIFVTNNCRKVVLWNPNQVFFFAFGIIVGIAQFFVDCREYVCFNFYWCCTFASYFAMEFKIIFSIRFFLYNSFDFQCLPSLNNFSINQLDVRVPMVFSDFNLKVIKNNMNNNEINGISNVNGMQSTMKRLKMIKYFKNKLKV